MFSANKVKTRNKMKQYLYLSLVPEALIASNLSPEEFGNYYATGAFRRNCDPCPWTNLPNYARPTPTAARTSR